MNRPAATPGTPCAGAIGLPETGWILARVWLAALEETARDFHGNWPKIFLDRAYEHATANWIATLEQEYDFIFARGGTMVEALRNYVENGLKAGLFRDASDFRLKEVSPNKVEVTIYRDIYAETYRELRIPGQSVREMTNARLGAFRAAIKLLAGIECDYEITAIHPDGVVEGFIERLR
jgi:hypothetical protein